MNYMRRNSYGLLIDEVAHDLSIKKYLNEICLANLCTYDGRILAAKLILKRSRIVPLFINSTMCLIFTKSIREYDCILLNFHNILSVHKLQNGAVKVCFSDLIELEIKCSYNHLRNQMNLCNILLGQ